MSLFQGVKEKKVLLIVLKGNQRGDSGVKNNAL